MPKRSWRMLTEIYRRMDLEEVAELLQHHLSVRISAKMARWIYRNLAWRKDAPLGLRIHALERIANDPHAPWSRSFLWQELEKHRGDEFGDWIIIALTRSYVARAEDAERFIQIYQDESAHPYTRGSAVFGLNSSMGLASCVDKDRDTCPIRINDRTQARTREICQVALKDQNAYARAGACWLATTIGGFEEALTLLKQDKTPVPPDRCLTVADYVE